mmetsp:Transcript_25904/g.64334  ORF Transcript_25904/g.64334 Transcript_25904/m.64334 type:complete len:256 (-) Transcript_25904:1996-2763(-)
MLLTTAQRSIDRSTDGRTDGRTQINIHRPTPLLPLPVGLSVCRHTSDLHHGHATQRKSHPSINQTHGRQQIDQSFLHFSSPPGAGPGARLSLSIHPSVQPSVCLSVRLSSLSTQHKTPRYDRPQRLLVPPTRIHPHAHTSAVNERERALIDSFDRSIRTEGERGVLSSHQPPANPKWPLPSGMPCHATRLSIAKKGAVLSPRASLPPCHTHENENNKGSIIMDHDRMNGRRLAWRGMAWHVCLLCVWEAPSDEGQ